MVAEGAIGNQQSAFSPVQAISIQHSVLFLHPERSEGSLSNPESLGDPVFVLGREYPCFMGETFMTASRHNAVVPVMWMNCGSSGLLRLELEDPSGDSDPSLRSGFQKKLSADCCLLNADC